MKKLLSLAAIAAVAFAASAPAFAQSPAKDMNGMLVGPNDMTLYVFDKDKAGAGTSACNGGCTKNWPPLAATGDAQAAGDYTAITREDGSKQWAYKGRPLYYWAQDTKPGEMGGDGKLNGAWHAAKP